MSPNPRPLFPVGETLQFAWDQTKENIRPLLVIGLTGAFLALVERGLTYENRDGFFTLMGLLVQLVQVAVTMAWIRVSLRICDGATVEVPRVRELWPDYISFFATMLLAGLITAVGFVLLIVPGVIWGLSVAFAGFATIDGRLDPIEALKESARLTRGKKAELFAMALVLMLLNFAGALVFGVGLLVTIPMTFIAAGRVFRALQQEVGAAAPRRRPAPPVSSPPAGALPH
jgi:uncharacterized membrane protein